MKRDEKTARSRRPFCVHRLGLAAIAVVLIGAQPGCSGCVDDGSGGSTTTSPTRSHSVNKPDFTQATRVAQVHLPHMQIHRLNDGGFQIGDTPTDEDGASPPGGDASAP